MMYSIDLTSVKEPEILPAGVYALQILSAEPNTEDGKNNIKCSIGFVDHPDAATLLHWVALPRQEDTPDKQKIKLLMTRRFLELFKIPYSLEGFAVEDFVGATATSKVGIEEVTDREGNATGRKSNRLQVPNLPEEGNKEMVSNRPSRRK